jgi:tetratricopeptide (TPR) repeat protein
MGVRAMTRINEYKMQLMLVLVGLVVSLFLALHYLDTVPLLMLLLGVQGLWLMKIRKQKDLLKNFTKGKDYLLNGHYQQAIRYLMDFVKETQNNKEVEHASMIPLGVYTRSAVAMAYNNIGIAYMGLKDYQQGKDALHTALEYDGEYAVPYYNLAAIAYIEHDEGHLSIFMDRLQRLGVNVDLEKIKERSMVFRESIAEHKENK